MKFGISDSGKYDFGPDQSNIVSSLHEAQTLCVHFSQN